MTERDPSVDDEARPSTVLSAFVESLVDGRRVAVLGEITSGLPERLAERGARLVHAYDADRAVVAEALARSGGHPRSGRGIGYAVLEGDLGVRDGAFDVVIIPDLGRADVPAELIRLARRILSSSGTLVAAVPNPEVEQRLLPWELDETREPIGYYDLYDLVSLQFSEIRMLGQAPFVGYTIADFAPEGELDISVDTSILEAPEAPEWFIAVGSDRHVDVESYAVVGLPLASVVGALGPAHEPTTLRPMAGGPLAGGALAGGPIEGVAPPKETPRVATSTDRLLLTEAQTKLAVLSAELDKLREREIDSARESRARGESAGRLSTRVVELEGELGRVTELARLAEERAQVAEERAQVAEERARVAEQRADTADSWAAGANARADRAEAEARRALVKLAEDDDRAITQRPPPLDDVPTPPTLDSMLPGAPEPVTGVDLDGLERLVAELNAKNEELEARAESFRRKAEALEPRIARLERELEARESMLATERERRGSVEKISAQLKLELATLREQVEAAPPADAVFDVSLKLEMDEEIARLEDALRERGHAVARLKEELREGERVGRELVEQLELSGAFRRLYGTSYGDQGRDGGRGEDPDLRARLAVLAETAAKTEADLTQASWRIAQLERQVELAERDRPPAVVHDELEQALLAARQEIAALRTSIEGTGASSALVEQSVLLSQVAGELDKGA